jgi:hypothetical protein
MRWVRLGLGVLGLAAMAYAVYGSVTEDSEHLWGRGLFLVGVLVAHDLVLLPVAIGVGWLVARRLPGWARAGVHSGLYASAVVTAIALPFVLGRGRLPDNPSKFPLDYGRGLLIVLVVIWIAVAVLVVRRRRVRRVTNRAETPGA